MQKIWLVKIPKERTAITKELFLSNLPKPFSVRANRFLNIESSLSYIIGRLLLKKALFKSGFSTSLLEQIAYSEHGKPSLIDFNFSISHSDWYVSLVFGTACSVGIDIQKNEAVDLKLFNYLFTEMEWNAIIENENPLERFYWFWVRKEALLKAAGCALKDLKQLEVWEHHGMYMEKRYYFKSFDFDTDFNGVVAMEEKTNFDVELMDIEDLLKE